MNDPLPVAKRSHFTILTTRHIYSAPHYPKTCCGRGDEMLWFIFLVLLVLWILGLVGTYQIGAWLWLLLVAAVIVLIVQLATGRRVAP